MTGEPGEGGWRRSVYIQQRRKHMMTLLETFDLPAMNPNCVNRVNSTVVQQPLFLLHDKVVHVSPANWRPICKRKRKVSSRS